MSDERKKAGSEPPFVPQPSRTITPREPARPAQHPIGTPRGLSTTGGMMAVAAWLSERGIHPSKSWRIDVKLDSTQHTGMRIYAESIDTRFQITIMPDEWSFYFNHEGRISRVRVTDIARADSRDDHNLTVATPALKRIGVLIRQLEQRFNVTLLRGGATIETTLPGTEPIIRAWVMGL